METNEAFKLILDKLNILEQGQAKLEQGQNELRQDVNGLKQGQAKLEQGQNELRQDVNGLKQGQAKLEIMQQETNTRLSVIEEDISEIKEDVAITRHSTNLLLKWAEKTDNIMKVGLYQE